MFSRPQEFHHVVPKTDIQECALWLLPPVGNVPVAGAPPSCSSGLLFGFGGPACTRTFSFFCEGTLPYSSFKFTGVFRSPFFLPRASPLLFVPGPPLQSPRSASLPFRTLGIHVECVPMFSFLHRISSMRESLLCAAYTADWCAWLGALSTFCNISCSVYLWTEHTLIDWSLQIWLSDLILFTDSPFCLFPFFNPVFLFWTLICLRIVVGRVLHRYVWCWLRPTLTCLQYRSAEFCYAQVFTLWLPDLLLSELSAFLYIRFKQWFCSTGCNCRLTISADCDLLLHRSFS